MVRVGTSGFSYPDWQGHVYPPGLPAKERLSHYASVFDAVEVNTTFYRQPSAQQALSWAERTPESFRFTAKVYGGITHDWTAATDGDLRDYAAGLEPLRERGRLGCVLAQFPNAFRPTKAATAHLARLAEAWPQLAVVVEFRHAAWQDERALDWLRERGLGFCCVDEPDLPGLMPAHAVATAPPAYVRFHGRNAAKWYRHEHAWERYDYRYRDEELDEWVPRVRALAEQAGEVYVFFNNHFEGQAADNARTLAAKLGVKA